MIVSEVRVEAATIAKDVACRASAAPCRATANSS